jgi:hypothetical protein
MQFDDHHASRLHRIASGRVSAFHPPGSFHSNPQTTAVQEQSRLPYANSLDIRDLDRAPA